MIDFAFSLPIWVVCLLGTLACLLLYGMGAGVVLSIYARWDIAQGRNDEAQAGRFFSGFFWPAVLFVYVIPVGIARLLYKSKS